MDNLCEKELISSLKAIKEALDFQNALQVLSTIDNKNIYGADVCELAKKTIDKLTKEKLDRLRKEESVPSEDKTKKLINKTIEK